MTSRRGFLASVAAALTLDPERALWVPGKKLISIPKPIAFDPTFVPKLEEFITRYPRAFWPLMDIKAVSIVHPDGTRRKVPVRQSL